MSVHRLKSAAPPSFLLQAVTDKFGFTGFIQQNLKAHLLNVFLNEFITISRSQLKYKNIFENDYVTKVRVQMLTMVEVRNSLLLNFRSSDTSITAQHL